MNISNQVGGGPLNPANLSATNAAPFTADIDACRRALSALPVDGPIKPLKAPVRAFARAASLTAIPPERMIAELKGVLFELPHFRERRAAERGEMMQQLVAAAINAFYARIDD